MINYYAVKNGTDFSKLLSRSNIRLLQLVVVFILLSFLSVLDIKNVILVTAKTTTSTTSTTTYYSSNTAFIVKTRTKIHQRQRQRQRQRRNQYSCQQNLHHNNHQLRLPTINLSYNVNNNYNNEKTIPEDDDQQLITTALVVSTQQQQQQQQQQQNDDYLQLSFVNELDHNNKNNNNEDIITAVRSVISTFVAVTTLVTTILLSTTSLDETISSSSLATQIIIIQPANAVEILPSTSTLTTTSTNTNSKQTNEFLLTVSSSELTTIQTQPIAATSTTASASSSLDTTTTTTTIAAAPTSRTVTMRNVDGTIDWESIIQKAYKKAIGGGTAGAFAAIVQVCSLMWLRTSMNYQYRYGGTLQTSLSTLYNQGGISRLYQGLPFALVQGPLTRFGDTAANVGILSLLESISITSNLPLPIKTLCTSIVAGLWRIALMPIDTSKTILQVEGSTALQQLWTQQLRTNGVGVLYRGSIAQALATTVGHFPWFLTYNFLDDIISKIPPTLWISILTASSSSSSIGDDSVFMSDTTATLLWTLSRAAIIGVSASCISDCSSNSLRVLKTFKQTAALGGVEAVVETSTTTMPSTTATVTTAAATSSTSTETPSNVESISTNTTTTTSSLLKDQMPTTSTSTAGVDMSYQQILQTILEKDGWIGLFGRGLQTRLLTNAIQGAAFSVLWKYFQQQLQQ